MIIKVSIKQYNIFGSIDKIEYDKENDNYKTTKRDMKTPSYWTIPAVANYTRLDSNSVNNLIKRVCKYYEISEEELMSKRRLREYVLPRQITMYILKNYYNKGFTQIAKIFNKNHSTVIHSCNTIEGLITYDKEIRNKVNLLK